MWALQLEFLWNLFHDPDMKWEKFCEKAIENIYLLESTNNEEKGKMNLKMYKHTNSILTNCTIQSLTGDTKNYEETMNPLRIWHKDYAGQVKFQYYLKRIYHC